MSPRRLGFLGTAIALAAALGWLGLQPWGDRISQTRAQMTPPVSQPTPGPINTGNHNHDCGHAHLVTRKDEPSLPLADDFLKSILSADEKSVTIPLPGGGTAKGKVNAIKRDAKGVQSIEGTLSDPEAGRFMFQRQTVP